MGEQSKVYINKVSKYLPNKAVSNEDMEKFLGEVNGVPSKAKRIVLRSNGIKKRYYAIDENGDFTHTNAELTNEAVKALFDDDFTQDDMELLSCGTSSPDQLVPSHAAMVHGHLANKNMELNSTSGVCCAGMGALKFGFLSVKSGNSNNAICTGSERSSVRMISDYYSSEIEKLKALEENQ